MSNAFDTKPKSAPPPPNEPEDQPGKKKSRKRRERVQAKQAVQAMRQEAKTQSYREARPDFREGDMLLFRGKGLIGTLIRAMTHSPYSHAGLVYRFEGRVYVLEAVGHGVRLILMSELEKHYNGGIDYYAVVGAEDEARRSAVGFCFRQLGKLYSKRGIFRFLLALLFDYRVSSDEEEEWFCSELVAAAYERQGLALAQAEAYYTSPNDLALSERVRLRFTIKED